MRRLAFVRFLVDQGVDQARLPQPLAATSVLSFHDAVELFLVLVGEHLQANLPTQIHFADYWGKLQPYLPQGSHLPGKKAMERMNKIRVNHKHHGSIPSQTDIEQVRADVGTFLSDATTLVFDADFFAVDMAALVTRPKTAALLARAEERVEAGEMVEAFVDLAYAFDEMVSYYGRRYYDMFELPGPLHLGPTVRPIGRRWLPRLSNGDGPPSVEEMAHARSLTRGLEALAAVQRSVQVLAAGIPYDQYARFRVLTPDIVYHDGELSARITEFQRDRSHDDYLFCRQFVVMAALQLRPAEDLMLLNESRKKLMGKSVGPWPESSYSYVGIDRIKVGEVSLFE
ncbi:hypothetical protein OG948_60335 (plasmid) [Embleya sp. NBC_00888]|uniref:hypothetical protein n=1 Tax=Embleya sp. NBC_00888 TaxID=2975960 RepID=UPI002F91B29D|nr:hypothetical protein OG948_60335 [Embleya sp. NBC_00888]